MSAFERRRETFRITTDTGAMDFGAIHAYLARLYWSEGIPQPLLQKAMAGSLCFGLLDGLHQIGFARVVTDRATFAYLCDVYVLEPCQGHGLGTWFMRELMTHPTCRGCGASVSSPATRTASTRSAGSRRSPTPMGTWRSCGWGLYLEGEKA